MVKIQRLFAKTNLKIPIYRADTLICKPQLNNTHGAVNRLLHFHYTEVPMSRFSEIAQIYDHRLLEAQFLRGNASYSPEPESGNVRNNRPVEQYRTVHKARRAFHSGIQKPHGYTAHVPFRCAPDLRKGVQFQVEALRANG